MTPLISVIFPCYNAESFIQYSLESVINQDYKNIEIICINDGSSDNTLDILVDYQKKDPRIIIINNEKNLGLISSLNNALTCIKGEYFARMDADDYSPPNRISKQLNFLLNNQHVQIVSSGCYSFINDYKKNYYMPPVAKSNGAIMFLSIFANPFIHGSIFGNTSIIKSGQYEYDHNYPHAEDFELFSRLAWNNCTMASMNEPLYWLRINTGSVSFKYSDIQTTTNLKIVRRNLNEYLNYFEVLDDNILKILFNRMDTVVSIKEINRVFKLLSLLYNTADEKNKFSKIEKMEIKQYLLLHKLNIIIQSNKIRFSNIGVRNIAFFVKSLFFVHPKQITFLLKKLFKPLQGA